MGRQSSDQTMVCSTSSIALLQERFRNLQKVKEKREEQQLLKMLSETRQGHHQRVNIDCFSSTRHLEPADHSLSLGLNLQAKKVDNYSYCGMKTQQLPSAIVSSWPDNYNSKAAAKESASAKSSFDHSSSDLDTSLHL